MSERTAALTPSPSGAGLVPGALLIALGGLFLLGNLGVIAPLSLRSVLSLWPLVPILIGIQLTLGRTRPSLAVGLQLAAVALGVALVMARAYVAPFDFPTHSFERGASPAIVGAPEVVVTARDIEYSLGELRLPSREVNLTLRNDGVLPHDLTIPALSVHLAAGSGHSVTTGLRDLPPGRYSAYCSVSGHADAGMELVVTVE
jgi:hypothetical protein